MADDSAELKESQRAAYQRWRAKYRPVVAEFDRVRGKQGAISHDDLEELKRKYPDAVRDYVALALFSSDVIRRMRKVVPDWRPPDPS